MMVIVMPQMRAFRIACCSSRACLVNKARAVVSCVVLKDVSGGQPQVWWVAAAVSGRLRGERARRCATLAAAAAAAAAASAASSKQHAKKEAAFRLHDVDIYERNLLHQQNQLRSPAKTAQWLFADKTVERVDFLN